MWDYRDMKDDEREREARRRLRAALDGVDLAPEETSDDRAIRESVQQSDRDDQLQRDVPPHHGG